MVAAVFSKRKYGVEDLSIEKLVSKLLRDSQLPTELSGCLALSQFHFRLS